MNHRLAIASLTLIGCLGQAADPSPTQAIDPAPSWSEPVAGHPELALVHERDATGDWATIVSRGIELCMFSTDPGEGLDYAHVAEVCGWPP